MENNICSQCGVSIASYNKSKLCNKCYHKQYRENNKKTCFTKSDVSKARWENPAYRRNQINRMKKQWQNPVWKAKQIKKILESNNTPEVKEKRRQTNLISQNNPKLKVKRMQIMKNLWSNSVWRENQIKKIKMATSTPEARQTKSDVAKVAANRPEVKNKIRNAQLIIKNTPEAKAKQSQQMIALWSNKEWREKRLDKIAAIHRRPEIRLSKRLKKIKQIEKNHGNCFPAYNKLACEYFRKFDEENHTKGKYAVYGGGEYKIEQLGYWVDYINFDLKLIMEWDEKRHYINGQLCDKDIDRQKSIQTIFPDFQFKRIRENHINTGVIYG